MDIMGLQLKHHCSISQKPPVAPISREHARFRPNCISIGSTFSCSYDVFSRLLKERIIMLQGSVDDQSSAAIVAMLLYLEADNPVTSPPLPSPLPLATNAANDDLSN
jgi:hypothetical protein